MSQRMSDVSGDREPGSPFVRPTHWDDIDRQLEWLDAVSLPSVRVPGHIFAETISHELAKQEITARALKPECLSSTAKLEIGRAVAQLAGTAIEIIPQVTGACWSASQCAALAKMMRHPIVLNQEAKVLVGLTCSWRELFRQRVMSVWQAVGLNVQTLTVSSILQSVPSARASGWAEVRGQCLRCAATWGLPRIFEMGTIEPDLFEIDLTSAVVRAQRLGQKRFCYQLSTHMPDRHGEPLALQAVPQNRQTIFSLSREDLQYPIAIARALAASSVPVLQDGVRFDWILGDLQPQTVLQAGSPVVGQASPTFYLRSVRPLSWAAPSRWPEAVPVVQGERDASGRRVWRGTGVSMPSNAASTIAASVFNCTEVVKGQPSHGHIWVGETVPSIYLPELRYAVGLIVESPSTTSHAILLARDLGLPTIVGVAGIAGAIRTGDRVELDAVSGEVRCNTATHIRSVDSRQVTHRSPQTDAEKTSARAAASDVEQSDPPTLSTEALDIPLEEHEATATHIAASIAARESQRHNALEQTERANLPIALRVSLSHLDRDLRIPPKCDGIGILRAEMLAFFEGKTFDGGDRCRVALRQWTIEHLEFAIARCQQRPILFRVIERLRPDAHPSERGMAIYFARPHLLEAQLEAIAELHRRGHTQVRLLLPFLRDRAELEFCWDCLTRLALVPPQFNIPIWTMAEVPSVLLVLEDYCRMGIAGIAIGANDLASLLLGYDRDRACLLPPGRALLDKAIQSLARTAKAHQLPCQLCDDDIVAHPEKLRQFIDAGVTALSVSTDRIDDAIQTLTAIEHASPLPFQR